MDLHTIRKAGTAAHLTQAQAKHLFSRLNAISLWRCVPEIEDPPEVVKARKVIERHGVQVSKAKERARKLYRNLRRAAEHQILFGSANEAIAAVEAYEKALDKYAD